MMESNQRFSFEAIGTAWQVDIFEPVTDPDALLEQIMVRIDQFDRDYSRFRSDSLITKMSQQAGEYDLPADAQPMFDLYRQLYDDTGGAMTPLIGQVLVDAGYDANYSFESRQLQSPLSWDQALDYQFPIMTVKQPALLDVGGAGKGYLVDIVAQILIDAGLGWFCVDAGGDLLWRQPDGEALRVGLEHPANAEQAIGIAGIVNQSICGSAGNRRRWGQYHHIINPTTLTSPENIMAVWVVAETTLLADALTTALFFVPAKSLQSAYNFSYAMVYDDMSLERSPDFPAEFFAE